MTQGPIIVLRITTNQSDTSKHSDASPLQTIQSGGNARRKRILTVDNTF